MEKFLNINECKDFPEIIFKIYSNYTNLLRQNKLDLQKVIDFTKTLNGNDLTTLFQSIDQMLSAMKDKLLFSEINIESKPYFPDEINQKNIQIEQFNPMVKFQSLNKEIPLKNSNDLNNIEEIPTIPLFGTNSISSLPKDIQNSGINNVSNFNKNLSNTKNENNEYVDLINDISLSNSKFTINNNNIVQNTKENPITKYYFDSKSLNQKQEFSHNYYLYYTFHKNQLNNKETIIHVKNIKDNQCFSKPLYISYSLEDTVFHKESIFVCGGYYENQEISILK